MNQPNSPRPGSEPSSKSLAQELFGVHFAPGGPVTDPDDLEGLDFTSLAEPAPVTAAAEAEPFTSVAVTAQELEPFAEETPREPKYSPPEKPRKAVPRIPVPRDDDDDGFGSGLLSAFDEDDDRNDQEHLERTQSLPAAKFQEPEDDDTFVEPAQPRTVRPAPAAALGDLNDDDDESDTPAFMKAKSVPKQDDFWDALEGWDWESSHEVGERGERTPSSRSDRPGSDRPRSGRSGRDRPSPSRSGGDRPDRDAAPRRDTAPAADRDSADERPRQERPRREDKPAPRDRGRSEGNSTETTRPAQTSSAPREDRSREDRPREDRPRGRSERSDRPARDARPEKPASAFKMDDSGFADDLFDRLAAKEPEGRPTSSRGKFDPDLDDDRDRLPLTSQTPDEPDTEADAGVSDSERPRRPRRRRGRGRGAAGERSTENVAPVESDAGFDDEPPVDEGDDDGFGSGLVSPRRSPERRPATDRPESSRGRGDQGTSRSSEPRPRRDREDSSDRPARAERGSRDDAGQSSDRPARREQPDRGRDTGDRSPRADRGSRDDRPARREPAERSREIDETKLARDDRGNRDDRPAARHERGERPERQEEAPRSSRSSRETSRRPESSPSPASSRRHADSDDREREEPTRTKQQAIEVPTWEHAISLLISRPPRQDRGDSRSGPRGDDRGSSRGRGRRGPGKG